MTAESFEQTFNLFRRRVPFHPFTVALMNGDRFEVDSPDALTLRHGTGVYISPGGAPWVFDHESVSQFIGELVPEQNG